LKNQYQQEEQTNVQEGCDASLFVLKQTEKRVEKLLYQYPTWKVNVSFGMDNLAKSLYEGLANEMPQYKETKKQTYQSK